jgi:2-polyprenyl-3-methyl-5-hydroxy-6-metoxy-1,4-benzoquinol methylase
MTAGPPPDENWRGLNDQGRALWDNKAAFWDALHGDAGNAFHRHIIGPAVERLLQLEPGERVLDVACGNGALARRLAALGGRVTAVDFSQQLLDRARQRGQPSGPAINYRLADATDETALLALGEGEFDAITSVMALMDMPVIAPFFRAARRLLRPGGRLIFATAHPAFNSNRPIFLAESEDRAGQVVVSHAMKIVAYRQIPPVKAVGAAGEPNPHFYYHRPLAELLGAAFAAGLALDGVEEPGFGPEAAADARPISWEALWQMPPVLAGRLRRSG